MGRVLPEVSGPEPDNPPCRGEHSGADAPSRQVADAIPADSYMDLVRLARLGSATVHGVNQKGRFSHRWRPPPRVRDECHLLDPGVTPNVHRLGSD